MAIRFRLTGNKHLRLTIFLLSLVACVAAGFAIWSVKTSGQNSDYSTMSITRGDIEKTVLATGILKPATQVSVGAQVNGQLRKLYVKQGDRVTRGQLLAEIDPTLQLSELRNNEAALKSAESEKEASEAILRQYQQELRRQRRMDREGSGVRSDLEQAQAQYDSQLAQVKVNEARIVQAQMGLETARANLSYTRIVAPIDGEVLGIVTKEGQTIVSSQTAPTILVLADVDTMTVHTRISETDILKVHTGQPLWFYVVADPQRRYDSELGVIQNAPNEALQEDSQTAMAGQQSSAVYYNGVFSVANPDRLLRTYMTAQVFIITERANNVLRIPVAALGAVRNNDRYQVQVVKDGTIEPRWVQVGINDRQFAEVKEGLQENERVLLTQYAAGGAEYG